MEERGLGRKGKGGNENRKIIGQHEGGAGKEGKRPRLGPRNMGDPALPRSVVQYVRP